MNDQQLLRYSRHILLSEIGIEGQQLMLNAHALIVGAGGLGCPAALYLVSSGIGTITLCDDDTVDLTNLQRQILHHTNSIGESKVASAQKTLAKINPDVHVIALQERIADKRMFELVAQADVIIDCSDNFDTRYALNHACLKLKKPLVSGAAIQFSGQLSVFDFRRDNIPCYNCLYPQETVSEELRCATTGIFAPLVGIIGSMQANEAIKLILGLESSLIGKLFLLDALNMNPRTIQLSVDRTCTECSSIY